MLNTPGLRVSLIGGVVFFFGLISLLFLPLVIAMAALLLGGFAVWGGFIWTLFSYYGPTGEGPTGDHPTE
jgi:hypothetical protein